MPIVLSSDLAVGENRFSLGLVDEATGQQLTGADLHFRFICYDTPEGTPVFEADPEAVTITKSYTHTHEDGVVESHEAGETGVYVAYPDFAQPGIWGVEVSGTTADGREIEPLTPNFAVNIESQTLSAGDPAPLSEQQTLADVADIREIDTSENPIPEQHEMTIAEAVTSGKPTVIAFATPSFCQTQICGPIKEIFDDLYNAYGEQANFVHVEPYDVAKMRAGECAGNLGACLVPVVNEWGLHSEPWVFIVDAEGKIVQKYDSVASYEEMEAALTPLLG